MADQLVSEKVRHSCLELAENSRHIVEINFLAIPSFIKKHFTHSKIGEITDKYEKSFALPFLFDTIDDEVNFTVISCLLAFGSGYRLELHQELGRGAADTMMYGLISMYSECSTLDAKFLSNLSLHQVSTLFNIPLQKEVEISKAVYKMEKSPLLPLVESIYSVLTRTGTELRNAGFNTFHEFFQNEVQKMDNITGVENSPKSCQILLKSIVNTFSAFKDECYVTVPQPSAKEYQIFYKSAKETEEEINHLHADEFSLGTESSSKVNDNELSDSEEDSEYVSTQIQTYVYKKAQLLISQLYMRYSSRSSVYQFVDIYSLTIFADNVIPAMLEHFDLLRPCERIVASINKKQALSASSSTILRAASIVVCECIMLLYNYDIIIDFLSIKNIVSSQTFDNSNFSVLKQTDIFTTEQIEYFEKLYSIARYFSHQIPQNLTKPISYDDMEYISECIGYCRKMTNQLCMIDQPFWSQLLFSPVVDFFFYTFGKSSDEVRKLERHILKNTTSF